MWVKFGQYLKSMLLVDPTISEFSITDQTGGYFEITQIFIFYQDALLAKISVPYCL